MIYNVLKPRNNINEPCIDQIGAFNQKFDEYCGNRVKGSQVLALIQAVNNNNNMIEDAMLNNIMPENKCMVTLEGKTNKSEIRTGNTYNVEITEYTKQGLINRIRITENEK